MSNAFNLDFTQDQLADLYETCENETSHAYDAVAEGLFQATREFARSLSPVIDDDGNELEEDSPAWEAWVEELGGLVSLENFSVDGFDVMAYNKRLVEARLATAW